MRAVIDADQAVWLRGPVSILLATADATGKPSLGIGLGCRVAEDLRTVSVFVLDTTCAQVLADVRAGRALAVTFTSSATFRALQLKASRASVGALVAGDVALMDAYAEAVAQQWAQGGVSAMFGHAYLVRAPGTVATVELVPEAAFEQTPGPRAGSSLAEPA